jgi:hypothetical protein
MPKAPIFNPAEYALVADRIKEFYDRYATGRIITHLVSRDRDVVFRAEVFRSAEDTAPAATGWASEREGDGEINEFACVENTETSAIGRALANLGFTASRKRASAEEMMKMERSRIAYRLAMSRSNAATPSQVSEQAVPRESVQKINDLSADVLLLLMDAKDAGVPSDTLYQLRQKLDSGSATIDELIAMERQLRHWTMHGYSATQPVNTSHQ